MRGNLGRGGTEKPCRTWPPVTCNLHKFPRVRLKWRYTRTRCQLRYVWCMFRLL